MRLLLSLRSSVEYTLPLAFACSTCHFRYFPVILYFLCPLILSAFNYVVNICTITQCFQAFVLIQAPLKY